MPRRNYADGRRRVTKGDGPALKRLIEELARRQSNRDNNRNERRTTA